MYFKDDKQISLFEFGQNAGMELDSENRWVKMAHKVDWDKIEGLPDERLVLHIQENPYMQYFCGIKEYSRYPRRAIALHVTACLPFYPLLFF